MGTLGDKSLLISRNISELLSANHHYEQLLLSDARREDRITEMLGCAERILKAANDIVQYVKILE